MGKTADTLILNRSGSHLNANQILQSMYDGRALVFGHRGARAYAPMNTLPAYQLALEQGAHGIELDVHRSLDGHPVIVHDFTVDATTNGSGTVTQMTLAQLKALDAGSWFDPKFAGAQIPTLDEVFEAVGKELYVNVEIKSVSAETDGVEQVVAECIRRHAMIERVIVSSFNPVTLIRFRALLPDVPLGFLIVKPGDTSALYDAGLTYEAYHPHYEAIDPALIVTHKRLDHCINTWTVNDPARAAELVALGVDGIITDNPDLVVNALQMR
jgi:glycerophosphoryl diester phosphodiesterase